MPGIRAVSMLSGVPDDHASVGERDHEKEPRHKVRVRPLPVPWRLWTRNDTPSIQPAIIPATGHRVPDQDPEIARIERVDCRITGGKPAKYDEKQGIVVLFSYGVKDRRTGNFSGRNLKNFFYVPVFLKKFSA